MRLLRTPARLQKQVLADIGHGTRELERIVGSADGLQKSARPLSNARHYSNALFNVMRGGIFNDGYKLDPDDLLASVAHANKRVAARHASFFRSLPKPALYGDVVGAAAETGDPHLERLCREYLPLTFSRRHGDPSRPWNRFSIPARKADGARILHYEGNWRDIFQNWEALSVSFPGYVPGMICRFLNASTADGYNPYRITRDGIDWEVVDPHDPWSYIGYWGDHQIIYLLKLLEILDRHDPAALRGLLAREIFTYANVPYRIKPYEALLANPKDTVAFDGQLDELIRQRVRSIGADGKLLWDKHGVVRLVNLAEKLLVPLLVKLSNFIPEAGIWLNTQRPEWNDANNALVGNGTSMVTLYYLCRHLKFCQDLFRAQGTAEFSVSAEVAGFFSAVDRILGRHRPLLASTLTERQRRQVMDDLGRAGSDYRQLIYKRGFSDRKARIAGEQLCKFLGSALEWANHSIHANRRPDGLYHAYNLVRLESKANVPIRRLYEMLEGQVAVLSSGHLTAAESLHVLTALRRSAMYRADQHSYLLYPNRPLQRFVEKNNIPAAALQGLALLRKLLRDGNRQLVERDIAGRVHFNPNVTNARDVRRILDLLPASAYAKLVEREGQAVLSLFERLFDHESFTGRSGTFFGYEGLGSIYWHMVSKLLLAAQETYFRAVAANAPKRVLNALSDCYYDIRAGIGDYKAPDVYGAFPMDPYSHTPAQGGARQPGLTGQVKEDFLCRFGELGVMVEDGQIHFRPRLLRREEFLAGPSEFIYYDVAGARRRLALKWGELGFTYCQTPVIYRLAKKDSLTVVRPAAAVRRTEVLCLEPALSREVFERTGKVARIEVCLSLGPERREG
jgi:hypothetical protein